MRELTEGLSVAIEVFGDPEAATLESVFTGATAATEQAVRDQQARVRAERGAAQAERDRVAAERDRIAAERDDAPPPHPGRTADRPGRDGAPLWRLVRFAGDVGDKRAAALEAALEATGMLDAWITPGDGEITAGDSDGYLVPGAPVPGTSLADVLVPEDATPVPAARVGAVLASIALDGELFSSAAVIGADGRYSHGVTVGAHHKDHAEYIGATARARRRAARIAEREARIAELEDLLAVLDRTAAGLAVTLAALGHARAALPRTTAITAALRAHSQAVGELRSARAGADSAQSGYDESVAACTVTERALRRAAIDHAIDPDQADRVEAATRRFETTARDLTGSRREETSSAARSPPPAAGRNRPPMRSTPAPRPNSRPAGGTPRRPPSSRRCKAPSARRPGR